MPADWQSTDDRLSLYHKDCREVDLAPDSIDAIVTDPPYLLNFMGKEWDTAGGDIPTGELVFRSWFAGLVA